MAEYIEKQAVISLLNGKCIAKYPTSFVFGLKAAANEVSKIPAADVVDVVRCNDCVHSTVIRNSGDGSATWHCKKSYGLPEVDPIDYCSHGERRDG